MIETSCRAPLSNGPPWTLSATFSRIPDDRSSILDGAGAPTVPARRPPSEKRTISTLGPYATALRRQWGPTSFPPLRDVVDLGALITAVIRGRRPVLVLPARYRCQRAPKNGHQFVRGTRLHSCHAARHIPGKRAWAAYPIFCSVVPFGTIAKSSDSPFLPCFLRAGSGASSGSPSRRHRETSTTAWRQRMTSTHPATATTSACPRNARNRRQDSRI